MSPAPNRPTNTGKGPSFFSVALSTWRAVNAPYTKAGRDQALPDAIVKLSIKAVPGARSADTLGAEREGTGVVIDASGLILTVGYLVIEAGSVLAMAPDGRVYPATVVGFDHASGFGLLKAHAGVAKEPIERGDASKLAPLQTVRIAAHAAAGGVTPACVSSRRRFTGWWEYMIDDAIFTAPPRGEHSGAALLDDQNRLLGIASLWVSDTMASGVAFPGNMFIPINLLAPILDDLVAHGRRQTPGRPWLGIYTEEIEGHVVVTRTLPDGPAARSGIKRGDIVLGVAGHSVGNQSEFYERLWASGAAGDDVTLHVLHDKKVKHFVVYSADRTDYFKPWAIR
ncbi:MAG: serine protease [Betaproteobacteria bacterium]|nr:serine protease [Betaproteobacteria bacterium]